MDDISYVFGQLISEERPALPFGILTVGVKRFLHEKEVALMKYTFETLTMYLEAYLYMPIINTVYYPYMIFNF